MSFRKFKGMKLSEDQQGELYFMLRNYRQKSRKIQMEVVNLCEEVAGEHALALFELLTRKTSVLQISQRYYVSESVLYELRRKFYHEWYQRKGNRMV